MDPRLRDYYERELQHLHEMGAEFAQQHPKIAARLGMRGIEVADPYVEQLLQGVSFLTARLQLRLDAEFPRFTQHLLEMVYPSYLAPGPAMLVAQLNPELTETNLATGVTVPRGSLMHGMMATEDTTACDFRTAHDVALWPLQVTEAKYFSYAPDLPLNKVPVGQSVKGGVRIKLKTTAGLNFSQIGLDRLRIYLSGTDDIARKLYELVFASTVGVLVVPTARPVVSFEFLHADQLKRIGFADDEALLPVTWRSFQGYRLLQEYFSFPQRFLFFDVAGLKGKVQRCKTDELELILLFSRGDQVLERVVDASNFALFCTPAINLFTRRADRIPVTDTTHEFHVVPDRTRPMDFEVYEVSSVTGYGAGVDSEEEFHPFYAATTERNTASAYFTTRREPRLLSDTQKRSGARTSYIGTEVFISLVDPREAPYTADLRQLSITTLCTNRDLALQMRMGFGKSDFVLDAAAPVTGIRVIKGPSMSYSPLVDGAVGWRFISHLSLNYLSLMSGDTAQDAAALREMLKLYAVGSDPASARQIEGIQSVSVQGITRRLPAAGPITFGRGLEIGLVVDDLAFEGGSAFLLGSVLEQFFARHVSINSFTETALRSSRRGEVMRWIPRWGDQPIL
ncbi:MAG: type VI secretion system baseplate subunit TssF [Betaproteobacteria bacterium]